MLCDPNADACECNHCMATAQNLFVFQSGDMSCRVGSLADCAKALKEVMSALFASDTCGGYQGHKCYGCRALKYVDRAIKLIESALKEMRAGCPRERAS